MMVWMIMVGMIMMGMIMGSVVMMAIMFPVSMMWVSLCFFVRSLIKLIIRFSRSQSLRTIIVLSLTTHTFLMHTTLSVVLIWLLYHMACTVIIIQRVIWVQSFIITINHVWGTVLNNPSCSLVQQLLKLLVEKHLSEASWEFENIQVLVNPSSRSIQHSNHDVLLSPATNFY